MIHSTMHIKNYVVFVSMWYSIICQGQDIECNEAFSCVGDSLQLSTDFGDIHSRGYKATSGSGTTIENTGRFGNILLQGAFSGYEAQSIHSDYSVSILGENGGMNTVVSGNGITGWGTNALTNSQITITRQIAQSDGDLNCFGELSCSDTTITQDSATISSQWSIEGRGAFSLKNSIINAEDIDLTIELFGYYAGYNGLLTCDSGVTCRINCYGNGCFGFQLDCVTGSDCIIDCDESLNINCPITYGVDTVPDIPNDELNFQFDITTQSLSRNEYNCGLGGAYDLDNYGENRDQDSGVSSIIADRGNICCRGSSSCGGYIIDPDIELKIEDSLWSNSNDIVCSGSTSCSNAPLIRTTDDACGNIYCTGSSSCDDGSEIESNLNGLVYCGGAGSCDNAEYIWNAENVYCGGDGSCANTEIIGSKNVYVTGSAGAEDTIIVSDGVGVMNVYLASFYAGLDATINCNEDDYCNVYCLTHEACTFMQVNSICNNVNVVCDDTDAAGQSLCPTIVDDSPSGCTTPSDVPVADTTVCDPIETVDCWSCGLQCENLNYRHACIGDSCYENCYGCEVGVADELQSSLCQCYSAGHINGCDACDVGYFKISYDFTCQSCDDFIGCLHCADFHGCQQCADGYTRTRSDTCGADSQAQRPNGVWHCVPNDASYCTLE